MEDQLRRQLANLDRVANAAALVELYRQGRITRHELGAALGLSRYETDGLLKGHRVIEDLITPEELASEAEKLRRLVGR